MGRLLATGASHDDDCRHSVRWSVMREGARATFLEVVFYSLLVRNVDYLGKRSASAED